ncbi:MAG: VWA domain-containing protein [Terriglobales bacterium]
MHQNIRRGFLAVLGLLATSSLSAAQTTDRPPAKEPLTKIRTTTRLVVVDVITTDAKGKPVAGLNKEDFTLFEDGKPQQIKVFSFQPPASATVEAAKAVPAAARLPENVFTNVPAYKTTGALNVILLDWLNTPNLNQTDARLRLLKIVDQLPQGRPVAIFLLGAKLQLIQDFTSDPEVLRRVVGNLNSKNSPLMPNPMSDATPSLIPWQLAQHIPEAMLERIIQFDARTQSAQTNNRVLFTLDALEALAQALAGYPGRKNVIWISEAFPLTSLVSDLKFQNRDAADNYSLQIARIADRLMSAQIAMYPVDLHGIPMNSDLFQIGNDGHDEYGRKLTLQNADKLSDRLSNARATMDELADETGGRAYYNTTDFGKVILASMEDGSTYYTLGYYPDNKNWDGKFRKIQVKTARHGVKLRYRLGYYAASPAAYQAESPRQRAIELGKAVDPQTPASTTLLFQAQVEPPSARTQNKVRVNFVIDPHSVSFDRTEDDLYHADLSCVVQVYSEKGEALRTESFTITSGLKHADYDHVMKTYVPCRVTFDLAAGSYPLRLAVRDEHTGAIGTANAGVIIPQESAAGAQPHD